MSKVNNPKTPFKEKVVQIYEAFLKGEDPSLHNPNFWDEFFLLRANVTFLEQELEKLSCNEVIGLKDIINMLFHHCVHILKGDNQIRSINSLQTLCALVRGVYKKTQGDYGFDVINLLIGFSAAEYEMQVLVAQLTQFLCLEYPRSLKSLVLKFLLILVTATENVSQNTLLEYLMMNSVFEAIIQILENSKSRQNHGYDAVLLLTILVNYRKYEAANPYIVKLSIVDSEMALNGFGQVVALSLSDFNRKFCKDQVENEGGFLYSLTSMVGNMFLSEEHDIKRDSIRANNAVLLSLYEAVHLNRNFLTTLTHCQTDAFETTLQEISPDIIGDSSPLNSNADHMPPSNLLVTFLEFSSIVMQNTKDEACMNTCKLCFIILTCISEDQYANSIMHDANLVFKVHLHRMPMRHRKLSAGHDGPSRPLACSLLDLMVEFVLSHMTKALPFELYNLCLGVIQRMLCYQKRGRVRLQYNWKELWTALISLLKFLMNQESLLIKNYNLFHLGSQVVNVLNLFITFGDTFLPSPSFYDELYYEIVRMYLVFDNMYSMALRYTTSDGEWKDSAAKLTNNLVNIRAIINHFTPKIDAYTIENHVSTLTEAQVLNVVRSNYDTLTLKLYDNLDQYERYCEKPQETSFFTLIVRSVVCDYRKSLGFKSLEMQNILQEFSTIT